MSIWCSHLDAYADDALKDDEGYAICRNCGISIYAGPLRERDLISCWDALARRSGYKTITEIGLEREIFGDRGRNLG